MTTPVSTPAGPLSQFLTPLLAFEAPFNTFFKPFFTPFNVDAEGPLEALNDLTSGVTPEFVKLFQNFPNLFQPPVPGNGNGTATATRAQLIEAARRAALTAAGSGGGTIQRPVRPMSRRSVG